MHNYTDSRTSHFSAERNFRVLQSTVGVASVGIVTAQKEGGEVNTSGSTKDLVAMMNSLNEGIINVSIRWIAYYNNQSSDIALVWQRSEEARLL